jgi:pullulanase/glycogen debranching enzyme
MKSSPDASIINPLCLKCLRSCKQPAANLLIACPRYFPLPFKVDKHRFDQMGLFDGDE